MNVSYKIWVCDDDVLQCKKSKEKIVLVGNFQMKTRLLLTVFLILFFVFVEVCVCIGVFVRLISFRACFFIVVKMIHNSKFNQKKENPCIAVFTLFSHFELNRIVIYFFLCFFLSSFITLVLFFSFRSLWCRYCAIFFIYITHAKVLTVSLNFFFVWKLKSNIYSIYKEKNL